MINGNKIAIPGDVDYEIKYLVEMMNEVDGIQTTESCFGHNKEPIRIFGVAENIEALNKFRYNFLYCNKLWSIKLILTDVTIANGDWDKIEFYLESDPEYIDFPVTQLLAENLARTIDMNLEKDKEN